MKEKAIEWLETYSNCEDLFHQIRHLHKVRIKQMISDRQFDLTVLNTLLDVGHTEIERLWSLQSPSLELEQSKSFAAAVAEIIEEKHANVEHEKEATTKNSSPLGDKLDDCFFLRKEKFQKAEKWAIENSFIDGSGKWTAPKGRLATFIMILQKEQIIKGPGKGLKNASIDQYFTERYKVERLDGSFKPSKAKKYENDFAGMVIAINQ